MAVADSLFATPWYARGQDVDRLALIVCGSWATEGSWLIGTTSTAMYAAKSVTLHPRLVWGATC